MRINKEIAEKMLEGCQKYVKKPIPVRAVQIGEDFTVVSLEGEMQGKKNDYLMEGVSGEIYCCDKEIFAKSYEVKK